MVERITISPTHLERRARWVREEYALYKERLGKGLIEKDEFKFYTLLRTASRDYVSAVYTGDSRDLGSLCRQARSLISKKVWSLRRAEYVARQAENGQLELF